MEKKHQIWLLTLIGTGIGVNSNTAPSAYKKESKHSVDKWFQFTSISQAKKFILVDILFFCFLLILSSLVIPEIARKLNIY